MVVGDASGAVLWRGGDPRVPRLADDVGFVERQRWDLAHAGANGLALALAKGRTMAVCRWEHRVFDQHRFSCVATPVRDPRSGRTLGAVNLTGTFPAVHRGLRREIEILAARLQTQLRTDASIAPRDTASQPSE